MKKIIPILIAILICFGVGCTASYFQSEAILNWYPTLDKPSLTPPDMAFPIAWSLIYLCMGISIGLIWHMWTIRRQMIIRLFGFQLLFNFIMEHFLLLSPESVARFCKHFGAGCACCLLYDRKLSGEEIFGIPFCSLSFVVDSCHLS